MVSEVFVGFVKNFAAIPHTIFTGHVLQKLLKTQKLLQETTKEIEVKGEKGKRWEGKRTAKKRSELNEEGPKEKKRRDKRPEEKEEKKSKKGGREVSKREKECED